MNMKSIYISERLHRQAKLRAVERGVPLNQLIADLVEQGLLAHAVPESQVSESSATYRANPPPITEQSSTDQWLDQLAHTGILTTAGSLSPWITRACEAARRGSDPTSVEPPTAAQVREMYRRESEHHLDALTADELLRQMRDEEL